MKSVFDDTETIILRPPEAAKKLAISVPSLYRMTREGLLPRPLKIGARASGWQLSVLNEYLLSRKASPVLPPPKSRKASKP